MLSDVVAQFQQQREDELRDAGRAVRRDVGDGDAVLPRRGDIDDVVTSGQHADVAQLRQAPEHVPWQRRLVGEDDGGALRAGLSFGRGSTVVDLHFAKRAQGVPGEVSRIEAVSIQHYYFHESAPKS